MGTRYLVREFAHLAIGELGIAVVNRRLQAALAVIDKVIYILRYFRTVG